MVDPSDVRDYTAKKAEDLMADILQMMVLNAEDGNSERVWFWGDMAMKVFRQVNARWRSQAD